MKGNRKGEYVYRIKGGDGYVRTHRIRLIGWRKARKKHVCSTCGRVIEKGEQYFVDFRVDPYFCECGDCCSVPKLEDEI